MSEVRIGVIGFGNMGSGHCKNLMDGKVFEGRLAAICDIDPEKLEIAKGLYADKVKYFDDAETMMKSGEVDAVIVAVPHYFHPPLVMKAFEYGLHAMSEKPAGVYTKQVREMNEAAAKTDKVFGVMFNQRTNPLYRKVKEMLEAGELGEIKRTNWIITNWYRTQSYYNSGGWRATWSGEGGGVLANQCPHQLDLWQWMCGVPVKVWAKCYEGKYHDIEVEDDVTAMVEYANGATGVFVTTTGDYPGTNRLEVSGTKGKLVVEDDKLTFYKNKIDEREFNAQAKDGFGTPGCDVIDVKVEGENSQHVGVLNNWVSAILHGTPLLAPGTDGIRGVMLENAMYLSSWTGEWVTLPVDEELFLKYLEEKKKNSTYVKVVEKKLLNTEGTY